MKSLVTKPPKDSEKTETKRLVNGGTSPDSYDQERDEKTLQFLKLHYSIKKGKDQELQIAEKRLLQFRTYGAAIKIISKKWKDSKDKNTDKNNYPLKEHIVVPMSQVKNKTIRYPILMPENQPYGIFLRDSPVGMSFALAIQRACEGKRAKRTLHHFINRTWCRIWGSDELSYFRTSKLWFSDESKNLKYLEGEPKKEPLGRLQIEIELDTTSNYIKTIYIILRINSINIPPFPFSTQKRSRGSNNIKDDLNNADVVIPYKLDFDENQKNNMLTFEGMPIHEYAVTLQDIVDKCTSWYRPYKNTTYEFLEAYEKCASLPGFYEDFSEDPDVNQNVRGWHDDEFTIPNQTLYFKDVHQNLKAQGILFNQNKQKTLSNVTNN